MSLGLHLGCLCGWQELKHLSHHLRPLRCISSELVRSLGLEQACSCLAAPQCLPQIDCFKEKVQIFRIWEKVNAIIVLSVHRRSSFIARVSLCACFLHVVSLMFDKHVHLPCPLSSKEQLEKYITFKICLIFINS